MVFLYGPVKLMDFYGVHQLELYFENQPELVSCLFFSGRLRFFDPSDSAAWSIASNCLSSLNFFRSCFAFRRAARSSNNCLRSSLRCDRDRLRLLLRPSRRALSAMHPFHRYFYILEPLLSH